MTEFIRCPLCNRVLEVIINNVPTDRVSCYDCKFYSSWAPDHWECQYILGRSIWYSAVYYTKDNVFEYGLTINYQDILNVDLQKSKEIVKNLKVFI